MGKQTKASIARARHAATLAAAAKVRAKREQRAHLGFRIALAVVVGVAFYMIGHRLGIEEVARGWEFVGAAVMDKLLFAVRRGV